MNPRPPPPPSPPIRYDCGASVPGRVKSYKDELHGLRQEGDTRPPREGRKFV